MNRPFTITGVRVTHRSAAIVDLEAASHDDPEARLATLLDRDDVEEAFVLNTCNRSEEYVVTEAETTGTQALADFAPDVPDSAVVTSGHEASLRHLLRVASGLDSQILGEDQILGQFRAAYRLAENAGAIGPVLDPGLLKAIHVGERARDETAINEGIVSLGSAAVQLVDQEIGLDGTTVLVIGAGEMATLVARGLAETPIAELRVVNRTPDRAAELAASIDLPTCHDGLEALAAHVRAADAVLSSTASRDIVIDHDLAMSAGQTLFVDLAQPRDIERDVSSLDGVAVHDLEGLEAVTRATHEDRREAAEAVESLIEEEYELLIDQYKRTRADAVIAGMYRGAEQVKRRELETALSRLGGETDLTPEEQEVLEEFADALVSQLLAVPTRSLREAAANDDWETITSAIDLFDPTDGDAHRMFEAVHTAEDSSADVSGDS